MEASKGESPLEMAKRLVRAVARAFYDDAVVAVLDALLRDRHLRDADMDQRMGGLSHKMVRVVVVGWSAWVVGYVRRLRGRSLTRLLSIVHVLFVLYRCGECWGSCWRSGSSRRRRCWTRRAAGGTCTCE